MESPLPASDALIRDLLEALNVIYIPAGLIMGVFPMSVNLEYQLAMSRQGKVQKSGHPTKTRRSRPELFGCSLVTQRRK